MDHKDLRVDEVRKKIVFLACDGDVSFVFNRKDFQRWLSQLQKMGEFLILRSEWYPDIPRPHWLLGYCDDERGNFEIELGGFRRQRGVYVRFRLTPEEMVETARLLRDEYTDMVETGNL